MRHNLHNSNLKKLFKLKTFIVVILGIYYGSMSLDNLCITVLSNSLHLNYVIGSSRLFDC